MKTYFTSLVNYDRYANELILNAIINTNEPEKPVQLMAHMLAAQQIWYNRCNELPAIGGALWPDWKADSFGQLIIDNHAKWLAFLNKTDNADFGKQIKYQNSKGEPFSNKLTDILAHLINHGTHHRAQAGQLLKLAGVSLPITDYIFYLRQLKS
ncbi:MAG: hypothetical protein JWQ63_1042 [Mucilaginibacter sp.]|jgi:uncharacterized damage-inducible protein DinB|nr:hypothetical protein [Mucilaginibacter sp.]